MTKYRVIGYDDFSGEAERVTRDEPRYVVHAHELPALIADMLSEGSGITQVRVTLED